MTDTSTSNEDDKLCPQSQLFHDISTEAQQHQILASSLCHYDRFSFLWHRPAQKLNKGACCPDRSSWPAMGSSGIQNTTSWESFTYNNPTQRQTHVWRHALTELSHAYCRTAGCGEWPKKKKKQETGRDLPLIIGWPSDTVSPTTAWYTSFVNPALQGEGSSLSAEICEEVTHGFYYSFDYYYYYYLTMRLLMATLAVSRSLPNSPLVTQQHLLFLSEPQLA